MFENSPLVDLAMGRSSVRQRILALLIDESSGRLHLREIGRRAGTSPGTASRELGKLVAAGLIEREAEGNQVYSRASESPLATMMRSLLVALPAPAFKSRPPRPGSAKPAPTGPTVAPASETGPTDTQLPESAASEETPPASEDARVPSSSVASPSPTPTPAPAPAMPDPLGLQIAGRLADSVRPLYGKALRGIYLHGARAAGPAAADADVEIIIGPRQSGAVWRRDGANQPALRKASGSDFAAPIDYDAAATVVERAEIFRDATTRYVAGGGR